MPNSKFGRTDFFNHRSGQLLTLAYLDGSYKFLWKTSTFEVNGMIDIIYANQGLVFLLSCYKFLNIKKLSENKFCYVIIYEQFRWFL